jgi:predicted amidohydrolase YtcJ
VSIANTEALRRAGITRDTLSPVETVSIEKDAHGDPTGVFVEREMSPVAELVWFRAAASFTHADRVRALPESARAYHAFGTTSTFEGHGIAPEVLRVYKEAYHDGALTMRASIAYSPNWRAAGNAPLGPFVEAWAGWLGEPGLGNDWLKMSGLHISLGRGPADQVRERFAPYTGWGSYAYGHGLSRDQAKEVLLHCATNNIRATMIGVADTMDLYEEVDRQVPLKGRRWVMSHISVLSPRDIERITRMGLVLTTHTNNYLYKGLHVQAQRLSPERHSEIVPLRSLLDAGVPVSLATDNVPVSLFLPVGQTIERTSYVTKERIAPEQALTRAEALRCATMGGAYLTFDEDKKGSLEPGKLADLVVPTADPLTVEQGRIQEIGALMTMVGGKIVHETPNWAG